MPRPLLRTAAGLAAGAGALNLLTTALARQAERRLPPDGRFVDLDSTRLHLTDTGRGRPLILVHGLGGQLRNFSYALTDLLAADHRVVCIDRPGYGWSTPAGAQPGIAGQGRLLARLADALALERPVLVGHSFGGAVALAAALDHPGRFGALALLAPLSQPQEEVPEAFRALAVAHPLARAALTRTVAVPLGRALRRQTVRRVFRPDPAPADFGTRGGGLLSVRPGPLEAATAELFAARDEMPALAARYGELDLPVRILFGSADPVLDPDLHGRRTAAALADGGYEEVPNGHMIPVIAPDACAATIRAAVRAS
jgi:pimeloyl-ACP methyl ester carboxylesterase